MKKLVIFLLLYFTVISVAAQQKDNFRVITYNILNGYDFGKDTIRRQQVQAWIKSQQPDVVALQELFAYTSEKLQEDAKSWGHSFSKLLKTTGYSVGITSRFPIETKDKLIKGMHHGALHCKTNGIDFFVVHLWPENHKYREEIAIITPPLKKARETNPYYVVLGDFNAHSPMDADLYNPNGYLFTRNNNYRKNEVNLIDYEAISTFLAFPLVDVCQLFTRSMAERGTFPGRILGPINHETDEQLISRLERIDYILVSPELAKKCMGARVCNGKANWYLSDHYPVEAEFNFNK